MSLRVSSPALRALSPTRQKRLQKSVEKAMDDVEGQVSSASGASAALAINFCEKKGWSYKVYSHEGRYYVARI